MRALESVSKRLSEWALRSSEMGRGPTPRPVVFSAQAALSDRPPTLQGSEGRGGNGDSDMRTRRDALADSQQRVAGGWVRADRAPGPGMGIAVLQLVAERLDATIERDVDVLAKLRRMPGTGADLAEIARDVRKNLMRQKRVLAALRRAHEPRRATTAPPPRMVAPARAPRRINGHARERRVRALRKASARRAASRGDPDLPLPARRDHAVAWAAHSSLILVGKGGR